MSFDLNGVRLARSVRDTVRAACPPGDPHYAVTVLSMALGFAVADQARAFGAGPDDPRVQETLRIAREAAASTVLIELEGA